MEYYISSISVYVYMCVHVNEYVSSIIKHKLCPII